MVNDIIVSDGDVTVPTVLVDSNTSVHMNTNIIVRVPSIEGISELDLAYNMCKFSDMSYSSPHRVPVHYESSFTFLSEDDAQCYIWKQGGTMVISFRGTESLIDVIADARIIQTELPLFESGSNETNPKVHCGFMSQFMSLKPKLDEEVLTFTKNPENSTRMIYFTGHSLGGGLATIAALHYSYKVSNPISCTTFGSPRAGNNLFASLFNSKIKRSHRFVNQEDPIPFVPSDLFYEHVAGIRYIDRNGCIHDRITENRMLNFLKDCICCCLHTERPIHDHSCCDYLESIKRYKQQWDLKDSVDGTKRSGPGGGDTARV